MNEAVIEARGLTRRFGSFTAVDKVSFEIGRGEIFGFLGANGAGKTTTIRMLTGLLAPSDGFGRVGPHDISSEPEEVKRMVGYMSQKFSLYADLTAWENIEFFAGIYRLTRVELRERGRDLLESVGLWDKRKMPAGDMPVGWRQRLALSCALLHRPQVVFLDEPTAGVDPVNRRRFWEIINSLADAGVTVIITTHYMDEAEYCRRLFIMHEGRIVALDSPGQLKNRFGVRSMEEVFVNLIGQNSSRGPES